MNGIAKKIYMGVMFLGENSGGVVLPPKVYIKEQLILFTQIPSVEELIVPEKIQAKQEAISKGKLIESYWWDISKESEPFSEIDALARYVGEDNENKGIEKLIEMLREPLSKFQDRYILDYDFLAGGESKIGRCLGLIEEVALLLS